MKALAVILAVLGMSLNVMAAGDTPIANLKLTTDANGNAKSFTNLQRVVAVYLVGEGSGITGVIETDPVFRAWLGTNTYIKVETDPVFLVWLGTNVLGATNIVAGNSDSWNAVTRTLTWNTNAAGGSGSTNGISQVLGYGNDANGQSIFNLEYIYDQSSSGCRVAIRQAELRGSNNVPSVYWHRRQLIATNGTTVALDWSNKTMPGVWTVGTVSSTNHSGIGSNLTNVDADKLDGQHGSYYRNGANTMNLTGISSNQFDAPTKAKLALAGSSSGGGSTFVGPESLIWAPGSGYTANNIVDFVQYPSIAPGSKVLTGVGLYTSSGTMQDGMMWFRFRPHTTGSVNYWLSLFTESTSTNNCSLKLVVYDRAGATLYSSGFLNAHAALAYTNISVTINTTSNDLIGVLYGFAKSGNEAYFSSLRSQ